MSTEHIILLNITYFILNVPQCTFADNLQPFITMYYFNQILKTLPAQTFPFQLPESKFGLTMVIVQHKEKVTVCMKEPQLLNYYDQRAEIYSSAYCM